MRGEKRLEKTIIEFFIPWTATRFLASSARRAKAATSSGCAPETCTSASFWKPVSVTPGQSASTWMPRGASSSESASLSESTNAFEAA